MRNVMSFLGINDSKGNLLFSLGKTLAEAMVKPEPEHGKHNSEANYAFFSSNLKLNKLMNDIADQVINEIRQQNTDRVRRPTRAHHGDLKVLNSKHAHKRLQALAPGQ